MAKLILLSTDVLWDEDAEEPHEGVVDAFAQVRAGGSPIWLISNHAEPDWLAEHFPGITHIRHVGRQSGEVIREILDRNEEAGLRLADVLVLGAKDEDFFMAVNARTLLIRCEWAPLGDRIENYGVPFDRPDRILRVIELLETKEPWYFTHCSEFLDVYALTNAGTFTESNRGIVRLVDNLRAYLKGGAREVVPGILLHLLSSIYRTDDILTATAGPPQTTWSFYPSSSAKAEADEVMAGFGHEVRCLLKSRSSAEGRQLFVRHKAVPKRHEGPKEERTNPSSQLESIHIDPWYRGKIRGRTLVVLDDYLTYGASFGVSAALLRKAGARKVVGIAMGKFGSQARTYDIEVTGNVFRPLGPDDYECRGIDYMSGDTSREAQLEFFEKFGTAIE